MTTLLFYKGTKAENLKATFWDRFICFVTRSRFSHVELVLWEHGNGIYQCISASTRDGGVRIKLIDSSSGRWIVRESRATADIGWPYSQVGKKYDYIGLLGTVIKTSIFASNSKQFCSRLIAEALSMERPWAATPEDLFEIT